ncbi:hypothetical protein NKR23_g6678 [Pleurostoma richardsiae]|uniref:Uncharacterized protein n=1 Tax=Pleurostoma richardsiae TaxID=41990 RepID=A0AA38RAJ5_9PEZI|nr:hypothetical protein NKR23_g6678 [Pleurostoma richardsiae]
MRALAPSIQSRLSRPAAHTARRAFSQAPAAAPVDVLHVWGFTAPAAGEDAAATAGADAQTPKRRANWRLWHVPDTGIEQRSALLRGAFLASASASASPGDKEPHPTESEEDVDADRSPEDPLPPWKRQEPVIPVGPGDAGPKPTESEEDVDADRSGEDPLPPGKHHSTTDPGRK